MLSRLALGHAVKTREGHFRLSPSLSLSPGKWIVMFGRIQLVLYGVRSGINSPFLVALCRRG